MHGIPNSIARWRDATIAEFGGVDGLVVNAGGPPAGLFDYFDDEAWQSAFELYIAERGSDDSVSAAFHAREGGGSIVTVTSSSVKEPIDMLLLSNVMRSGVTSLAKAFRNSWRPKESGSTIWCRGRSILIVCAE